MRYSNIIKSRNTVGACHEERFRKEFERAFKDGQFYGVPNKKGKRFRSAFTTEQVHYLEKEFRKYPYIGNARRKDVANVLDIPERAVKIWFQNRRMKEKKDTLNKETESEKSMKGKEQLINVCGLQSTNDASLPMLTVTSPISIGGKNEDNINAAYHIHVKDLSYRKDIFNTEKKENPSVIQSNPVLSSTKAEVTCDAKKYKTEHNSNVCDSICVGNKSSDTSKNEGRQASPTNPHYFEVHQNLGYPMYAQSSAVPEDLSSKSFMQSHEISEQKSLSPSDIPYYMPYAPPYLPSGNMIWKPVSMAPIIATSQVPPLTLSTGTVPQPNILKRSCTCDCHKPYIGPMMLQNQPTNTNVQYVITAVPFQNQSPKF